MALKRFLKSDWFLAALFLAAFLLTNRYIYGWDDQHLEIPLLKHLIDPQLYQGDYYVESLKANFTSFLYPLLARVLKIEWIPSTYLILYLVARYFLFFFIFRLWHTISQSRWIATLCTLGLFLLIRPEEFIYRTFSHQEFSYIFVFSGLLYFFRSRYCLAALLFGLGANIHALYCLFPMMYLGVYLLIFHKERKWELIFKSAGIFILAASPFLIWTVGRAMTIRAGHPPGYYDSWIEMYHLSCPQNFIFGTKSLADACTNLKVFFTDTRQYFFVGALYLFNLRFNDAARKEPRLHAIAITTFLFIFINFCFTYIWPSHFVLDLNLVRNEQFLLFFLGGYSIILVCRQGAVSIYYAVLFSLFSFFLSGKSLPDVGIILLFATIFELLRRKLSSIPLIFLFLSLSMLSLYAAGVVEYPPHRLLKLGITMAIIASGVFIFFIARNDFLKSAGHKIVITAALLSGFINFCYLHYTYIKITREGQGFWQLQRNWEDMQHFVKSHTPKDALILAPNDMEMGGFRIHSNRRVLVCYRDCGIVGFDYGATKEWQQRMTDIDAFKVFIKEPFTTALISAILKYNVNYVVFMKYASPPDNDLLKKLYENEVFSFYQVLRK